MVKDISRKEEKRGTRSVILWGVAIAAAVFIALILISVFGRVMVAP